MKVPRSMDMVKTRYGLMKDGGDETACERSALAGFDQLVEVTFHGLEHEVELFAGRQEKEIVERDYVGVIWDISERLEGGGDKAARVSTRVNGWVKLTCLELLEFFALVPTAFPSFLHSLDGYESLVGVLRTRTRAALHRGQRCIGG
jgi:hypothetical protein